MQSAPRLPAQSPLASGGCRHLRCFSAVGVTVGLVTCGFFFFFFNLWVLIVYLFFLPVMLPSVLPRLGSESVSWCLETSLFLRLPSWDGAPSLHLLSLFLSFIFFLPPFEDNGLLFWVPDVLCWHSEVVLWILLSV